MSTCYYVPPSVKYDQIFYHKNWHLLPKFKTTFYLLPSWKENGRNWEVLQWKSNKLMATKKHL